tara:strand:+ start:683 stop:1066 length:384 start_codon:yes stop_codon:yes gene_type:complete
MGYQIDHALTNYYGDCLWTIEDSDYSKLDWDVSNSKSKPTLEDLQSKVTAMDAAEPMKRLRAKRDQLLAECDWVVTKASETGVAESDAWKTYRQSLRDLPSTQTPVMENPVVTMVGITSVTWPIKPS